MMTLLSPCAIVSWMSPASRCRSSATPASCESWATSAWLARSSGDQLGPFVALALHPVEPDAHDHREHHHDHGDRQRAAQHVHRIDAADQLAHRQQRVERDDGDALPGAPTAS